MLCNICMSDSDLKMLSKHLQDKVWSDLSDAYSTGFCVQQLWDQHRGIVSFSQASKGDTIDWFCDEIPAEERDTLTQDFANNFSDWLRYWKTTRGLCQGSDGELWCRPCYRGNNASQCYGTTETLQFLSHLGEEHFQKFNTIIIQAFSKSVSVIKKLRHGRISPERVSASGHRCYAKDCFPLSALVSILQLSFFAIY
jgi:hypothetical protein